MKITSLKELNEDMKITSTLLRDLKKEVLTNSKILNKK